MRRIAIAAALTGGALFAARALASRLHGRMMATCERMFAQMPEDFPPKRMMRSIDEIRANSERILELLSGREQVGEPELVPGEVETTEGENAMVPA